MFTLKMIFSSLMFVKGQPRDEDSVTVSAETYLPTNIEYYN